MKKILSGLAAASVLLVAVSCTKTDGIDENIPSPVAGTPATVSLHFSPAEESLPDGVDIPLTRAPFDVQEDAVENVWVFQFDGAGDDAKLVCPPYYIDGQAIADAGGSGSPVAVPLIDSEGGLHRVVLTANINNENYPWGLQPGTSTLADLKSRYINVDSGETSSYGNDDRNIVMSGSALTEVTPGVHVDGDDDFAANAGSGVPLTRSLAKVELDLSIDPELAAGYEVVSVQLRQVSSRLDIADALIDHPSGGTYPDIMKLVTADYPIEADYTDGLVTDANDEDNPVKFAWYVPRNARGSEPTSISPKTKTAYAPVGATFFEIIARDAEGDGIRFRVFPGADNTSDYNVIPNHRYRSALNITGDGGEAVTDSRIEQFKGVVLPGDNNSFILNPPPAGIAPRRFSVPVTQVNRYWESMWLGYGGIGDKPLQSDTKWTVQLLWQDAAGIVRPAGADADRYVILEKATGTGGGDYFTVTVPEAAERGNFVVALKIDGNDDVWWSWHLWVTDYNPDANVGAVLGGQFVYTVPGGQVERYGGAVWGYFMMGTNNPYNYAVTSPTPAAPYAQSVIMDRALGAESTSYSRYRNGLYYQFGRKDPFPGDIPLYKIDGTAIGTTAAAGFKEQLWSSRNANGTTAPELAATSPVRHSVLNPMRFYNSGGNDNDWSGLIRTELIDFLWYDADPAVRYANATQTDVNDGTGRFGKSVYDPCPPGWHVPLNGTWEDFRRGSTVNYASRGLGFDQGGRYWPYIRVGTQYPVGGDIFYPMTSARGPSFTTWNSSNCWTAGFSPALAGDVYYMRIRDASSYMDAGESTDSGRSIGNPVRCIRQ